MIGIDSKYLSTGYSRYTFDYIAFDEAKVDQILFNKTRTNIDQHKHKKQWQVGSEAGGIWWHQ